MEQHSTSQYKINKESHFPSNLFKIIISLTILLLIFISYTNYHNQQKLNIALQKEINAELLSNNIIYYDEVLTSSARLAVLTNDPKWKKRYFNYEKKLADTLNIAQRSLPKTFDLIIDSQSINKANTLLINIETKALALLDKGEPNKAKSLLFSDEYQKYKLLYSKGMKAFQEKVHNLLKLQIHKYINSAIRNLLYINICILLLIIFASCLFRRVTQWQSKHHDELNALYKNSRNYHLILNSAGEGIYGLDSQGKTTFVNQAACKILGYTENELIGKPMHFAVHYAYPDGSIYPKEKCPIYAAFREGKEHCADDEVLWHKSGKAIPVRYTSTPIFDDKRIEGAVVTFLDTTKEQKIKEQLNKQAHYDKLTSLPNRYSFSKKLEEAIQFAKRENTCFAVMLIDMDNFKLINDTKGHDFGDKVLCALAQKFTSCIRCNDYLARLGGDEFSIIFEHFDKPETIRSVAKNMLTSMQSPLLIDGNKITVSVSLGIAVYPLVAQTASDLLKRSDIAMYKAKEVGKNTYVFYSEKLHQKVIQIQAIEDCLINALEKDELILHYQPIFDSDIKLVGLEALLRWQNTALNTPSPAEFIPIAEQSSLINKIGNWVIKKALSDIKELKKLNGLESLRVSINVSTKQLISDDFYKTIEDIVKNSKAYTNSLVFEITETALMTNIKQCSVSLEKISKLGIKIALDDFGTGYSSMLYLKNLPIHYLKIDQGFVRDIGIDENDSAIVRAIIELAKSFGLTSVAEGVETNEQLEFLKSNHCQLMQGFLLAKPMSKQDIIKNYSC